MIIYWQSSVEKTQIFLESLSESDANFKGTSHQQRRIREWNRDFAIRLHKILSKFDEGKVKTRLIFPKNCHFPGLLKYTCATQWSQEYKRFL